uniref:sulfotransferase family protein n=1 Tax=Roseobacter litoralis TaxID=42443 RepID=UPI002494ADA2
LSSGLTVPDVTDGTAAFDSLLAEDRARDTKNHHILVIHRRLRTLLRLYPDMRFIHLVRDPRDVAHSSIGMGWAGNTWFGVDHWIGTESEWDKHSSLIPPDQVFSLRYEDMLEAPEETLTRMCAFIGVPYHPAMMDFPKTSTYAPLDPKLAYQWRRKQIEDEVADVEYKVSDILVARGYSSSGFSRRAPSLMRKLALLIQNKAFVWSFRLRRFGLIDSLLEVVARRTGLIDLGKGARARIRAKQIKHLK